MADSAKTLKRQAIFDTQLAGKNLGRRSIRSGAITLTSQGIKFGMQLVSTMVLARLLTPDDFGLLAMVTALTGLVVMFKDLGLSMATIQQSEINHRQVSTLFWVNVGVSVMIAALVALASPAIAWFYKEPRLTQITLAMSLSFMLGGLSIQHSALLRRQMKFGTLETVEIVSLASGVLGAVLSAFSGAGYWSLIVMHLIIAGVRSSGVWVCCGWLPGKPERGAGVRKMLKFGLNVTGFDLVNYFARNMDNILIGRFYGPGPLGLYAKAYQIMMMPIKNLRQPLLQVVAPALSRLQNNSEQFRNYYINYLKILSALSMPIVAYLFVYSKEIILVIFGPNWIDMEGIFKALAIAGFIQPVATTRGIVMISLGQSNRYFKWGVLNSLIVISAFCVGLHKGAIGVAVAYAAANYIVLVPSLLYTFRFSSIRILDFFSAIWRSCISSIVMAISLLLIKKHLDLNYMMEVVIMVLPASILFCMSWLTLRGGYGELKKGYRQLKECF